MLVSLEAVKIAGFKVGKRKTDLIQVEFDDGSVLPLDPEIIVRFQLKVGQALSDDLAQTLRREDEKLRARRRLVRYLSVRKKTIREARRYLESAGFSDQAVEHAVQAAISLGLLDDQSFAVAYVRTSQKVAKKGPRALEHELTARGVDAAQASYAVDEHYPPERQRELARAAAQKRLASLEKERRQAVRQRKLFEFLLRRGFASDMCQEIVRELLGDSEPEENC